jgi:hypothetical protein
MSQHNTGLLIGIFMLSVLAVPLLVYQSLRLGEWEAAAGLIK